MQSPQSPQRQCRIVVLLACMVLAGCASLRQESHADHANSDKVLSAYTRYNGTPRQINPTEYIDWLKANRYRRGELDAFPKFAILLHHADLANYLASVGIPRDAFACLDIGETDPSLICRVKPSGSVPFVVSRGMPGAGGASTATAELAALGTKYIVHIGTAAFLGAPENAQIIVSSGAYKDGAAVLLSASSELPSPISVPDERLSSELFAELERSQPVLRRTGFTIPIFYYQPAGLIAALFTDPIFSSPRPAYLEMEGAPFFETAIRSSICAASIVVPSDAYTESGSGVAHVWLADTAAAERRALTAAINVFAQIHADGQGTECNVDLQGRQ